MDYILQPSGLTIQELREHPEGVKGKVIIPPEFKTYEKNGLLRRPEKWSLYRRCWNVTVIVMDTVDCRSIGIIGKCLVWIR